MAPRARAAKPPMTTEAITALVPETKNHGKRGRMAPMAKETKENMAARPADPGASRVNTQLEAGVRVQGHLGVLRQDAGHRVGVFGCKPLGTVHTGEFTQLSFGLLSQLLALDLHLPLDQLLLRPDRDQLARRHRKGAGQQSGHPGQADGGGVG